MNTTAKPSFEIPNYIKFPLQFFERAFPVLCYYWVRKIFFRPIKFSIPDRENNFYKSFERLNGEIKGKPYHHFIARKGNKKKVLLVHGWSGRASQFYKIAQRLLDLDYEIHAFTAIAHVGLPGNQTHMLEFRDIILKINQAYGPFDYAIGHSLGGVALLNAIPEGLELSKLIIMGSPESSENVIDEFCDRLGLSKKKTGKFLKNLLSQEFGNDFSKYNAIERAKKTTVEGLIIHDHEDGDVPFCEAENISKNWKTAKLIPTKGLGHRRILTHKSTIQEIETFFDS